MKPYTPAFEEPETEPVKKINLEKKNTVILGREASINMRSTQKEIFREFPGGIVVRIQGFQCCGAGSTPDRETDPTDRAVWQKNPPRQKIGSINLWCVS